MHRSWRSQHGRPCTLNALLLCSTLATGSIATVHAIADGTAWESWDFVRIIRQAEERYQGRYNVRRPLLAWHELIRSAETLPEDEQLEEVNDFFNRRLDFVDDLENWQDVDYWATPVESQLRGAGDCEDYALAKYFTLRRLGVPPERLRITYVKALRQNQAHMVLTYYPTPTADPLVLDNLDDRIRRASRRSDLLPVYSFNGEGMYLPGASGGQRVGDSKKLSRWQDLLTKMRAEGFSIGEG